MPAPAQAARAFEDEAAARRARAAGEQSPSRAAALASTISMNPTLPTRRLAASPPADDHAAAAEPRGSLYDEYAAALSRENSSSLGLSREPSFGSQAGRKQQASFGSDAAVRPAAAEHLAIHHRGASPAPIDAGLARRLSPATAGGGAGIAAVAAAAVDAAVVAVGGGGGGDILGRHLRQRVTRRRRRSLDV